MNESLRELLEDAPVIAAIKDDTGLEKVVLSDCRIVFVLYGNLCSIGDIVKKLRDAGKMPFVHVDLLEGASNREIVIDFIRQNTCAEGIISTKAALVHRAKELGFYTVHRFFLLDSMALASIRRQIGQSNADAIEILPGCMPKIIKKIRHQNSLPVIASGLIYDKEDVVTALSAGAAAISSTCVDVWAL